MGWFGERVLVGRCCCLSNCSIVFYFILRLSGLFKFFRNFSRIEEPNFSLLLDMR